MKVLLHACCSPCASWCVEKLAADGHDVTVLYDNPNIFPESERSKRLDFLRYLCGLKGLPLIEGRTPHGEWLERVKGLENEPEHGKRCDACFRFNLELAAREAASHGFDGWTTSLTVSRFKKSVKIFSAADGLDAFLRYDFKKEGGFEKSCRISESLGLYRQKYCGCEFSLHASGAVGALTEDPAGIADCIGRPDASEWR